MFVDAESIKEQQRTESLSIQAEMYSWLLRRKIQGKIFQEFLDIETTNARLKKARSQLIANIMRHSSKRMPYVLDAK